MKKASAAWFAGNHAAEAFRDGGYRPQGAAAGPLPGVEALAAVVVR
ncbi:hypothetical protein J2X12_001158 [Pseudarthrobacter oxydans]|uniref:Uncharacterized protein n=1 Tax=Pseudarthrobacter oxydans TaxID=1671 RepID=A0AAW8N8X9_PSEOX|nr:hypothetical protein [Pseudarthrobacter oxydans]MDR7163145.1 hypothetical protein [Pseudarthrobacter oxydans]